MQNSKLLYSIESENIPLEAILPAEIENFVKHNV